MSNPMGARRSATTRTGRPEPSVSNPAPCRTADGRAGMPYQSAVTLLAPVLPEHRDRAATALKELAGPSREALAFDRHASLHFARLLLLDGAEDAAGHRLG